MEREIKIVTEPDLLREAWGWDKDAPEWFKDAQEGETEDEFVATRESRLFYGIWDERFTALIRFTPFNNRVFEVDLFCRRHTDPEMLLEGCRSIRDYLIDKGIAAGLFGWIPAINRGVRKLYNRLDFTETGVTCYRGATHGRAVKWLLMRYG